MGKVETMAVKTWGVTATTRVDTMSVSRCNQTSSASRSSDAGNGEV